MSVLTDGSNQGTATHSRTAPVSSDTKIGDPTVFRLGRGMAQEESGAGAVYNERGSINHCLIAMGVGGSIHFGLRLRR